MIFYFIATRPFVEKALGDKMYFDLSEARDACQWANEHIQPSVYRVFQAEAVHIQQVPA